MALPRAGTASGGAAPVALVGLAWLTYFPVGLTNTFANQLLAGVLFTLLVAALGQRRHAPKADRVLGDLTYATYLLHLPLLILVQRLGWPAPAVWALAGTYAGSLALLVAFELPLDRLRDRLYSGRGSARAACCRGPETQFRSRLPRHWRLAPLLACRATCGAPASGSISRRTRAPRVGNARPARSNSRDAGAVTLTPELRRARRIVIDCPSSPGPAMRGQGLRTRAARFRWGSLGMTLAATSSSRDGRTVRRDPPGWSLQCRTHRLVIDGSGPTARVAVDSLWVLDTAGPAPPVRAGVRALRGSHGSVRFREVFLTMR